MRAITPIILLVGSTFATPALAAIDVVFDEGAPKDQFTITNSSACTLQNGVVTIDLGPSKGKLIFDTTATGAGVEVFQPFEMIEGATMLAQQPEVSDGDKQIVLPFKTFEQGSSISFTIDVDDTIGAQEITVSNTEIEGAGVTIKALEGEAMATFSSQSSAMADWDFC